jgi:hypothetical protein
MYKPRNKNWKIWRRERVDPKPRQKHNVNMDGSIEKKLVYTFLKSIKYIVSREYDVVVLILQRFLRKVLGMVVTEYGMP